MLKDKIYEAIEKVGPISPQGKADLEALGRSNAFLQMLHELLLFAKAEDTLNGINLNDPLGVALAQQRQTRSFAFKLVVEKIVELIAEEEKQNA